MRLFACLFHIAHIHNKKGFVVPVHHRAMSHSRMCAISVFIFIFEVVYNKIANFCHAESCCTKNRVEFCQKSIALVLLNVVVNILTQLTLYTTHAQSNMFLLLRTTKMLQSKMCSASFLMLSNAFPHFFGRGGRN